MAALPHRIRRLSLIVKGTSPQAALALRKELRDHLDDTLFPALSRACDEAGPPGEILHIPRIELRLELGETGNFVGDLAGRIEQELRRMLVRERVEARHRDQAQTNSFTVDFSDPPAMSVGSQMSDESSGPDRMASQHALFFMLVEYLKTGSLPWPLASLTPAVVRTELENLALATTKDVLDHLDADAHSLCSQVEKWFRWLQLLPEEQWVSAAETVSAQISLDQRQSTRTLIASLASEQALTVSRYTRLYLAAMALAALRTPSSLLRDDELESVLAQAFPEGHRGDQTVHVGSNVDRVTTAGEPPAVATSDGRSRRGSPFLVEAALAFTSTGTVDGAVGPIVQTPRLPEPVVAALHGWLRERDRKQRAESPQGTEPQHKGRTAAIEQHLLMRVPTDTPAPGPHSLAHAKQTPILSGPSREGAEGTDAEQQPLPMQCEVRVPTRSPQRGQLVHHAGLILLHPFLPKFFESREVKESGQPKLLPDQLPRAAALLHYLATGETEASELDLAFIKILLGESLECSLPIADGLLDDADREDVGALLSATISHWQVLKNTSPQALRGSFLQRGGIIHEEERDFRLRVESAPFDMLLGQLPWGIGTVKLPWMKRMIFTEWPAR